MPGMVTRLRMTPNKVGEFSFHCDIFCGSGQGRLPGQLSYLGLPAAQRIVRTLLRVQSRLIVNASNE